MTSIQKCTYADYVSYNNIYELLQRNYRVYVYINGLEVSLCIGADGKCIEYETESHHSIRGEVTGFNSDNELFVIVEYMQLHEYDIVNDLIKSKPMGIDDVLYDSEFDDFLEYLLY